MLGQIPLPAGESGADRFQSGSIRVGQFFPSTRGSAAARPDGSGRASNIYRIRMVDANPGSGGGVMTDLAFISDRDRGPSYLPTQFNYLIGMGSRRGPWSLQFDREEVLPLDRKTTGHRYWDVRLGLAFDADLAGQRGGARGVVPARYLAQSPKLVREGKIRGELSVGYFLHNNSFPARFDNSGLAFLRYNARGELRLGQGGLKLFADADMLTDQHHDKFAPANLDLSLGIALSGKSLGIELSRETSDMLDRDGYAAFYMLTFRMPLSFGKGRGS